MKFMEAIDRFQNDIIWSELIDVILLLQVQMCNWRGIYCEIGVFFNRIYWSFN